MIDLVFKNYTSQKSPRDQFFRRIIEKSFKTLKLKGNLGLSVNLVGETKIKGLNKKYRHKDKPTDVLSFPMLNKTVFQVSGFKFHDLGDIFICLSIAKKDAKRENITIEQKLAQLTVHGFLHLVGYDHENSIAEAKKVENLEENILRKIGLQEQ